MPSVGNILLEKEILLESGTNELEILIFRLGDYTFGINVAKVREVLPRGPVTALPKAHASVLGAFQLRETVVPVVSLRRHLQVREGEQGSDQTLILADFNQQQTAFVVDAVERIHRISWEQILAVPAISSLSHSPVTAVARIGTRLVIMLDFEMITDQVTEQFYRTAAVANPLQLPRQSLKIVLADDSPTVREAVSKTLGTSGYSNLRTFENGRETWDWLAEQAQAHGQFSDFVDLLISDVEMPQIDGLHLTKRIKEHPKLKDLPVLLYSSIVTPDNYKKGAAVGADAQISKPELAKVVEIADGLIAQSIAKHAARQGESASLKQWLAPAAQRDSTMKTVQAEQEPTWEIDDDNPPPSESNPRLWQTFRAELADRARHLRKLLEKSDTPDTPTQQEIARTLHTIKSAAMVVPVGDVTRVTHQVESLIAPAALAKHGWPGAPLDEYLQWLDDLTTPGIDLARMLTRGRTLCEQFAR